ncbi:FMN-linked oxidoreductase [Mycena sanguinolenta]|nr:FMN-linked oxidoreductase [Mycena sanguinolenta]
MSPRPTLLQPIKVGEIQLEHRVVLAPSWHTNPTMVEYYTQRRARVPGTLLIAEATLVASKAGGFRHMSGIWSPEQIAAWKQIANAVHANGSFIFLQLLALGRTAYVEHMAPGDPFVSSRASRAMTTDEIKEYSELYATAAANADTVNERTDEYGGSIKNRARFVFELLEAIAAVIGPTKTAIRLSPWRHWAKSDIGMADPKPTYSHLVREIRDRHPDFGYIHLIEDYDIPEGSQPASADYIREIWGKRTLISAGGYSNDRDRGVRVAEEKGDLIAYSSIYR